jgi:hypothetical protein
VSVQAPVRPRRFPWLALCGLSAVVAVAVPATREAMRWRDPGQLQRVLAEQAPERYRPEQDPRVGVGAPAFALEDTAGRRVGYPPRDAGRPSALLFIGECTHCVAKTLAQWERLRQQGGLVYVVTSSDAFAAQQFLRDSGLGLRMLLEETQPAGVRPYNAAFRPRAFVVDATGKLIYAQADGETTTVALDHVAALLRSPVPRTSNR